jgi:hypothetical protein
MQVLKNILIIFSAVILAALIGGAYILLLASL